MQCHAHRGVDSFELRDRISRQNQNRIRKYLKAYISSAWMGSKHEKNGGRKPMTHSL